MSKSNSLLWLRLRRFRQVGRAVWSLRILMVCILASSVAELWINDAALIVVMDGRAYFPVLGRVPPETLGLPAGGEVNYRELREQLSEDPSRGWILLPLIPYSPTENDFVPGDPPPNPPSREHWFGTDDRGRDLLARLVYGFRISILFALGVSVITMLMGVLIGTALGYFGGITDLLFQRLIDIWRSIPSLYIIMTLASIFEPTFFMLLLIMVAFEWIGITFYLRTESYRERGRDYIAAARSLGATHLRIITRHIVPNAMVPVITLFPFAVVGGIFALTGLDFLGYGLPPPTPSWGELFKQALNVENRTAWWLYRFPFIAVVLTLTVITCIGDGIREAFDPRAVTRYS